MGFLARSAASVACGLLLFPQHVAAEIACPTKEDLTVFIATNSPICFGDGVLSTINLAGIVPEAEAGLVVTDEVGNESVGGLMNGPFPPGGDVIIPGTGDDVIIPGTGNGVIFGGTGNDLIGGAGNDMIRTGDALIIIPGTVYAVDVNTIFLDNATPRNVLLACETLSFDLAPTCSCGNDNDNCTCDPVADPDNCPSSDLICCAQRNVCDEFRPGDDGGTACGDPHMTGFLGQKFDFTGEDGEWYSIIADSNMNVNMRVTSPVADLPEITYITGLSVLTTDADGLDHSIVIEVADPHSLDSSCPAGVSTCLADGALRVLLDGNEALFAPGTVSLGPDVEISAANLPGACRSFGFEKYWERKKLEFATDGRRLRTQPSMGEWILGDPTATNMNECVEYVARAKAEEDGVFAHQSEHASFQIVTPAATVRLSHGRLHQIAMRDPTDQYDLLDHLTWQVNLAVDHNEVSHAAEGILGETFVSTRDASGKPILNGMKAIRGTEDDWKPCGGTSWGGLCPRRPHLLGGADRNPQRVKYNWTIPKHGNSETRFPLLQCPQV